MRAQLRQDGTYVRLNVHGGYGWVNKRSSLNTPTSTLSHFVNHGLKSGAVLKQSILNKTIQAVMSVYRG